MSGRAETRTPEPPNHDKHENSPPRLARPKHITRPPTHYAQDQEIDTEQRTTHSQQKKNLQGGPISQHEVVASNNSPTDSEDLNNLNLIKELIKLRREIRC
jgi:hypothetical protein